MNLRIYILRCVCLLAVTGCKEKDGFKKGDSGGMQYKFFKIGEGQEVQEDNILKLETVQKYNDSTLHDTRKEGPQYLRFDSTILSKETYVILGKASVGDSLVFKVEADSAFKGKKPPFVRKKGGHLFTYIKVVNIFRSEQEFKAAEDPEGFRREQQGKDGWGGQGQRFNQGQNFRQGQQYTPQIQGMGSINNQAMELPELPSEPEKIQPFELPRRRGLNYGWPN